VKEKEQHIDQLLLERDLERSEVAKSAVRLEDVGSLTLFCLSFETRDTNTNTMSDLYSAAVQIIQGR